MHAPAFLREPSSPARSWTLCCLIGCLSVAALSLTGCQVDIGGQTLPSAYYLQDDIQYFPAGPEFKLSKEAAALKAASPPAECESCH
jgi:hypothetical protein